jgi:arylsulfatase A-like enzyme
VPRLVSFLAAFLLLALLTPIAACRHPAPDAPGTSPGPIVLITFDGLRADMVGSLGGERGLTPNLDRLAARADWAGRAIAPSSWTVPSMASLWTGLRPWQHQAIDGERAALSPDLLLLPEALQAAGYRTRGFPSGPWLLPRYGYGRGFDELLALDDGDAAIERLKHLSAGREFVWIHVPEPHVPWVRRPWLRDVIQGELPGGLPRTADAADLAEFADPSHPLSGDDQESYRALYLLNVVWADMRLGLLLNALKASGRWDRTLLVVTSAEGEALGEGGQVLTGGDLGRELIEVPLAIKLATGTRGSRRLAVPRDARPSTQRLFATLLEAAGVEPAPAVAPSLFRRGAQPALSELYLSGGENRLSLVDGDDQLLWETRFLPPSPEVYRASYESRARPIFPPFAPPAGFPRLAAAFDAAPPLSGSAPAISLRRWDGASTSRFLADPARRTALAAQLRTRFWSFLAEETTPGEEARER